MGNFDPRVDAYIAKSAEFAQPIIIHLRQLIHNTGGADIQEVIKWGMPFFDYKGAPFVGLAAFKQHMGVNFWKTKLMDDPHGLFADKDAAFGSLSKIKSLADLPPDDVLIAYLKNAMALNEQGIKISTKSDAPKAELVVPEDLIEAFKTNQAALQHFEQFSYSAKKEYLTWLEEAKTADTRAKRLATTLEWVAEGKQRHWKYKK